jgi:hypothetical protein
LKAMRLAPAGRIERTLCAELKREKSMKRKWSVVPDQASGGKRLCIMLNETVVAITPAADDIDRYIADHIVSAMLRIEEIDSGQRPAGRLATDIRNIMDRLADLEKWRAAISQHGCSQCETKAE